MAALTDKFGRPIIDLRISITDHCNYKCVYCRTGNEGALYADLPFTDYLRMTRVLVGMGIKKVRITGGEPLLRKGVVGFVRDVAKLRDSDDEPLDIAITSFSGKQPNGAARSLVTITGRSPAGARTPSAAHRGRPGDA